MEKKYEDTNQNSKEPILKENIKDKITEENHKISYGQHSEEKKIQKYGEKAEEREKSNSQKNEKENKSSKKQIEINEMKEFLSSYCKDFDAKFELLDCLKSGSAGTVFSGKLRNNPNSKLIAFKFLIDNVKEIRKYNPKEKSKKNKNNQNKHFEISIHGMLKHKNIPEIYGYYKILNDSCIAMEFTKYGDIENFKKKILKRTSLSETLTLYIAGGILEALKFIHIKNKIIHMDIKQQNILIDDFLSIKLTDFSVSINYKSAKDYIDLPMVGTCYYMSPEVLKKKRILVSEASKIDIYSLGVLLYLLAFYDYPYKLNEVNSKDYFQISKNIANNNLEFPEETGHSKVFINFLKNCLNKDIKKRYDICQAMKDPWVKGYQIILNEKEKLYNAGKFVIDLMVDNFITFNNYIKEQEKLL
jgi:serine/threonine protein kinase